MGHMPAQGERPPESPWEGEPTNFLTPVARACPYSPGPVSMPGAEPTSIPARLLEEDAAQASTLLSATQPGCSAAQLGSPAHIQAAILWGRVSSLGLWVGPAGQTFRRSSCWTARTWAGGASPYIPHDLQTWRQNPSAGHPEGQPGSGYSTGTGRPSGLPSGVSCTGQCAGN